MDVNRIPDAPVRPDIRGPNGANKEERNGNTSARSLSDLYRLLNNNEYSVQGNGHPTNGSGKRRGEEQPKSDSSSQQLLALERLSDSPLRKIPENRLFSAEEVSNIHFLTTGDLLASLENRSMMIRASEDRNSPLIRTPEEARPLLEALAAASGHSTETALRFVESKDKKYMLVLALQDDEAGKLVYQFVDRLPYARLPARPDLAKTESLLGIELDEEHRQEFIQDAIRTLPPLESPYEVPIPFDQEGSTGTESEPVVKPNYFTEVGEPIEPFTDLPEVPINDSTDELYRSAEDEQDEQTPRLDMMEAVDIGTILDSMPERSQRNEGDNSREYVMRVLNERFNRAYDQAKAEADADSSLSKQEKKIYAINAAYDRIQEQIEIHRQLANTQRVAENRNFWAVVDDLDVFLGSGARNRISSIDPDQEQELLDDFLLIEIHAQLRGQAGETLRRIKDDTENKMARSQGISPEVRKLVTEWLSKDNDKRDTFRLAAIKLLFGAPEDPYRMLENEDIVNDKVEQLIRFGYLLRNGNQEEAEQRLAEKILGYHTQIIDTLEKRKIVGGRLPRWVPVFGKSEDPAVVEMISLLNGEEQDLPARYLSLSAEQRGFIADLLNSQVHGNKLPREALDSESPFSIYKLINYAADSNVDGVTTQDEVDSFNDDFYEEHEEEYEQIDHLRESNRHSTADAYAEELQAEYNQKLEEIRQDLFRRREQMLTALDTFVNEILTITPKEDFKNGLSTEQVMQIVLICHRLATDGVYNPEKNQALQDLRDGLQDLADDKAPDREIELPEF